MSKLETTDFKGLERINASLSEFISLETWTPAMGAMLICGIFPVGRPTEVPNANNLSLRDHVSQADQWDVNRAQSVLKDWVDRYLEDEELDEQDERLRRLARKTNANTVEFLMWCHEHYENSGGIFRPTWLNYWETFCDWEPETSAPAPVPATLVARAVALEDEVSRLHLRHSAPSDLSEFSAPNALAEYAQQLCENIDERATVPHKQQIIEAVKAAKNPKSLVEVWVQLCEIAKSKKSILLKYESDTQLQTPGNTKSGWQPYRKDALRQLLGRYSPENPADL